MVDKKSLYRGVLDNLPTLNSRIVRIFISSTFTDTREERNILIEEVYPKLKTYCREKYGLEFQVVDMRWGVPEEAADDHAASTLCIQEIYNCQKLSTGPNFVAFLNQRHGYRPLQPSINSIEFESLVTSLEELDEDTSLLHVWYKLDTNASPAVYMLQPISSIIPEYKEKKKEATDQWENVYNELHWKLKRASQHCQKKGVINADQKHKYFMSVTEEEIVHGILQAPGSPTDTCLCFVRIIEDLEAHLDHKLAWRFIDISGNSVDTEAQDILKALREEKVPYKLQRNIPKLSVTWNNTSGINRDIHAAYLKQFADLFFQSVTSMLDKAVSAELMLTKDELYTEVLQHSTMAKERCKMFHGREEILDMVMDYIRSDSNQPFTVYGPSGSGKTSILAKLARQVYLTYNRDGIVILRFLGTSPDSSNVNSLLQSICQQMSFCTNGEKKDFSNDSFEDLVQYFQTFLNEYSASVPLVIFLDSLDQLTNDHSAHKLRWLPKSLAKNVKLVLSAYTDSRTIISTLQSFFTAKNFCMVPALGQELSFDILKSWMKDKGRHLVKEQSQLVQEAFVKCSLPIYVKLVFENVMNWKSYTPIDKIELAQDVKSAIEMLFKSLEQKHGIVFVQRAFSYLTASGTGLSELELEDVMSLDDEMLTEIFRYHVPPIRRIPSLLWARLRYDIDSYLVTKEVDETQVSFWYHRQFLEAAVIRYLSTTSNKALIHSNLADYYLGIWFNKAKPFKYTELQAKKLGLTSLDGSADRKVAEQPLSFTYINDKETKIRYNKRKLNKLPLHLTNAGRHSELKNLCLFNFEFLDAKIHACPVSNILADYTFSLYEGSLLHKIIKSSQASLQKFPRSLAMEISGHLLPFLTDKRESPEKNLVSQCLTSSWRSEDPIPYLTCYTSPNEALLFKLQHRNIPYGNTLALISKDSKYIITLAGNNLVLFWDFVTGEIEKEVEIIDPTVCKMNIIGSNIESNQVFFATTYQQNVNPIVVMDMTSSDIVQSVHLEKTYPGILLTQWLHYCMTDNRVFVLAHGESADVFDLESGKLIHDFGIKADSILLSRDQKKIVFHLKEQLTYIIFNTKTLEKETEFCVSELPKCLLLSPTGCEAIVLFKDSGQCQFLNVSAKDGPPGHILCNIKHPQILKFKDLHEGTNGHFMLEIEDGFILWNYSKNRFSQEFRAPETIKPEHRVLDFHGYLTSEGNYFIMLYEWHMLLWNMRTGKLICIREISKSKLELLLVDQNNEKVVTVAKRQNAFSVWRISSLLDSQSLFSPLTLSTGPRYISVSKEPGNIAVVRGNSAKEMVVIDLDLGRIKCKIAETRQSFRPEVTPDGKYAVLREYAGEMVMDDFFHIWNLENGKFLHGLPGDYLRFKYWTYSNSKVAIYCEDEDQPGGEISVMSIETGKLINTIKVANKNKGDMVLLFDKDDENIIISRYKEVVKSVEKCDIFFLNGITGEEVFSVSNIAPLTFQALKQSESLYLAVQLEDDKIITIVIDGKARRIIRQRCMPRKSPHPLYISLDGKLGLDRTLVLYDLEKLEEICQFDKEEEQIILKQVRNTPSAPKIMADCQHAVWINLSTNLLKVGNIKRREIQSVFPIHSVPLFMEVSSKNLTIIGCEDGRLMVLQLPVLPSVQTKEDAFNMYMEEFNKRLRAVTDKFTYASKNQVVTGTVRIGKTNNKSSICLLL